MRIIGIDPGLAIVGYCILDLENDENFLVSSGSIQTDKNKTDAERLLEIQEDLTTLIEKYKPDQIAVEELFFNNNITTGIAVAEARGVILLTAVKYCGALYEYTPLQIKQAITGNGRAEKKQVQYMTVAILGLKSIPKPDDAADALAAALCHAQTNVHLAGTALDTIRTGGNYYNKTKQAKKELGAKYDFISKR